jgi:hypothetical protein
VCLAELHDFFRCKSAGKIELSEREVFEQVNYETDMS